MSSEVGGQVPGDGECASSSDDPDIIATHATEDGAVQVQPDHDDESEHEDPTPEDATDSDTSVPDFSTKSWKEDLTLIVEGKRLYVSSSMLAYTSPVFSALFEEKFATDGPREIELPGRKYSDFVEFLRCIHPTVWKPVTMKNVFIVLPLVKEYRVEIIKERIEQVLVDTLDEDQTPSNICMLAREASVNEMPLLFAKCIPLLAKLDRHVLRDAEKETPLPSDVKYKVEEERNESLSDTIDSLSINIVTLKLELKESKSKYESLEKSTNDLEEMAKALWNNDGGKLSMRDNKIGVLRFTIEKLTYGNRTESDPVQFNGMQWAITARQSCSNSVYIDVALKAETLGKTKLWSRKLQAKLRILRPDVNKGHIWRCESGEINSTKSVIAFTNVIKYDELSSKEFTLDDKVVIEVFILVEDLFAVA